MTKISFPCIILFLSTFALAQENPKSAALLPLKNEIGINLLTITDQADDLPMDYANILSGIYYKRHFGKNALRFSFDYSQNNLNQISPTTYRNTPVIDKSEQIRLGYQRRFSHGLLSPFVYIDALAGFKQYLYPRYGENFHYTLFGGATGAGLRYQVSRHLAISYELAFIVAWDKNYSYYTFSTAYLSFNPIKQLGISFLF